MDDLTSDLGEWAEAARLNMRRLMESQRWSYGRLSKATGLPRSTISNIANGEDKMTIRVLVPLAAAFNVSTDELLGLGTILASAPHRKPSGQGGVVDIRGVKGRFIQPVGVSIPELGLFKGDLLEMEAGLPIAIDKIVIVSDQDGVSRLYKVRSLDPTILVRGSGPAIIYSEEYLRIEAVAVQLHRKL